MLLKKCLKLKVINKLISKYKMSNKLFIKHFKKLTKILNENDEINTHSLQRKLRLGYSSALKIYKYLKEKKIIKKEEFKTVKFGPIKPINKVGVLDHNSMSSK